MQTSSPYIPKTLAPAPNERTYITILFRNLILMAPSHSVANPIHHRWTSKHIYSLIIQSHLGHKLEYLLL